MRALVTGHRGLVGRALTTHLRSTGCEVVGFDATDGDDVLDLEAVRQASTDCQAIVHLAAIAHDSKGTPEAIMSVNVLGTWNVLLAAEHVGASRVIHFSSAQVFGTADGERMPDYFPIDDAHSRRAMRPYGVSKRLSEDMCEAWSRRTGIPSVSLRPVAVWDDEKRNVTEAPWKAERSLEGDPFWEYGAWVHTDDVAAAVELCLSGQLESHSRMLLCSDHISGSSTTLELAARFAPDVPLRNREAYVLRPDLTLCDCSSAKQRLGWQPQR